MKREGFKMKLHELKNIIDSVDMEKYGNENVKVITINSVSNFWINGFKVGIASDITRMAKNPEFEAMIQELVDPDDFIILVPYYMHSEL